MWNPDSLNAPGTADSESAVMAETLLRLAMGIAALTKSNIQEHRKCTQGGAVSLCAQCLREIGRALSEVAKEVRQGPDSPANSLVLAADTINITAGGLESCAEALTMLSQLLVQVKEENL
jgi:hypothetical protein